MTIKTRNIADSAVTAAKIAASTITDGKVAALAAASTNLATTMLPRVAIAQYDFTNDGGAVGAITLTNTVSIPAGAVVLASALRVTTAVTSAGSATISVGTTAGSGAASIAAATAKASLTDDTVVQGIDYSTTKPFVMTAAGNVNVTVATAAVTAGVVEIFVLYTMGAEGAS